LCIDSVYLRILDDLTVCFRDCRKHDSYLKTKIMVLATFVTPDYGTIFWMVIIFGIALFFLGKFAWKPIIKALKDREKSIAEALSSSEKAKEEMKKLKDGNEKIMSEARQEKENILNEAKKIKEQIVGEAREEAKKEGQKIIESARQQINTEKQSAISDMKKGISELSIKIAEKIIRKELKDKEDQKAMINDLLKEVKLK